MTRREWGAGTVVVLALILFAFVVIGLAVTSQARAVEPPVNTCYPIPVTPDTPTGLAGCQLAGEGIASHWGGPGVARNDCTYPWIDCRPIRITALETGRAIVVWPTMFCDCYVGTPEERLVDLDPAVLSALGLDPAQGLYPVRVEYTDNAGNVPGSSAPEPLDNTGGAPPPPEAPAPVLPDTAMLP